MDLQIASKCFIEQDSDLIVDSAGNRIPAMSVICCKLRTFVITEDGDIDKFAGEEMDVIYQATDEDFNFFQAQVRELDAERNQSIITSIFRTLTGTRCKTRRRQVTSIPPTLITPGAASPTVIPSVAATPDTHVTIMTHIQEILATTSVLNTPAMVEQELSVPETVLPETTANNESQLDASYLNNYVHQVIPNNNVSMCSSDSFAQENLKTLLNERLNDQIYCTFKETFSNTNLDSISELSPKVCMYNKEIAKFIQEVNMKYSNLFDYTILEISEVPHWVETFQVLVRSNVQPEVQPTQVPTADFSVPPLQVSANLSHQQAEINRLMQVMQQWSADGPHQYN